MSFFEKIDNALLGDVQTLDEEKRWQCIIHANDFLRTKRILLHRKIKILDEYLFIKAFRVEASRAQLFYLAGLSQVKYLSSVARAAALMHISKKILGVDESSVAGKGQTIAFIDTGINRHCDFCLGQNRLIFFKDFISDKSCPYDDNGHGTFVAGVCSGNGAMSVGKYCGIAPQSNIISLKALDKNGEASADKILKAMEWIYDNHKTYGIKVVCMSFGSEPLGMNDPIMSGADSLWRENITVVAAAGNSGPEYQTIKSPGVSGQIITVGGFDDNRGGEDYNENFFEIAPFSSRGPAFKRFKPDIVAPAVDIISCGIKKTYTSLSGTSVATPMIAGLCALLQEKYPQLTPYEIKGILCARAKPICFNRNFEGLGYPQIATFLDN